MFTVSRKYGLWPLIGIVTKWGLQLWDFCVSNLLLTACRQPKSANVCKITKKYNMFTVSRKYGLWPLIGIVMKWGSQWCDFCMSNPLLTVYWQPKRANVCKITKNTKCSLFVESMGWDHSLESSWNKDRNDVTFVCLTRCWQPVSSLKAQMFAKSQKVQNVHR